MPLVPVPSKPCMLDPATHPADHRRIVLAGMLALATAMGIGRFAFTPLLPMMLHDGSTTLAGASWLASANYIGYLAGALLCMFKPVPYPTVMVRVGLVSTLVLTLCMALPWPAVWPLLRFAAGVSSALVFVYTSGWCLSQAALRGHTSLGALIYTGPGAGIVLTGLAASGMVVADWHASSGWLTFGLLALALIGVIWPVFNTLNTLQAKPASPTATANAAPDHSALEVALLALAYGIAGFGYIITATFLPVIARQALPGSAWLDLFWPILGCGVIVGALVASRMQQVRDLRLALLGCYLIQAAGVALSLVMPNLAGFALGSLLVGLPFTAITYFAMQEARRIRPHHIASTIGLLTALYGLGQILGPPMAACLLASATSPAAGFDLALTIATGSLVFGAVMFGVLARGYPVRDPL
ncbi:MAG: YbfB/YjiJ family MFS transporter [Burkholderiaceae bacterium]|jgi:MFS family permease|nr:YbfB/YjiJ family MFS transporter [Burkholderiaceae bacterium]